MLLKNSAVCFAHDPCRPLFGSPKTHAEASRGCRQKFYEIKGFTCVGLGELRVIPLRNVVTSAPPRVVPKRRKQEA
jgi:hypothetical protein